ncbi:MAG: molybdopterin-guanine dinucleotide biosynthesis protein B, partial [bacterium]|nr:molybdopterin-guanine dinucleotide biosynthesis protein B [bacterium]
MKVFTIAGWSGSGKTVLITQLIKQFRSKNKKVAAVKHAPHKYYLEPEAADTFKFLDAGSDEVCLVAQKQMLFLKPVTGETDIFGLLETRYGHCDFLLLEGLRRDDIPLMEVFDSTRHDTLKFPIERLIAVVSDKPVTDRKPNFNRDEIKKIIEF